MPVTERSKTPDQVRKEMEKGRERATARRTGKNEIGQGGEKENKGGK